MTDRAQKRNRKKGRQMKTRLQIGWLVAGLAAVAVLLVVVAFAIGVSAGPDEPAPGPEEYHIYDGRAGIQIEAEVINASRDVVIMDDPQYIGPVTMITFGLSPMSRHTEIYDHNGYVLSKLTTTTKVTASDRRMFRMTDEEGNILAEGEGQTSGPFFAAMDPLNPLYSYQLGSAITPYWLALLQQN